MGVPPAAIERPRPLRVVRGNRAFDGKFDLSNEGEEWIAIPEQADVVFWQPRTDDLATWNGRQFALGEFAIDFPVTYAMGYSLNIYANPLDWLRAGRDGIVVINWAFAFDYLRDAPRIAVDKTLLNKFKSSMKPRRMPVVSVLQGRDN
ncbi:hypothetical protein AKG11_30965 [Shinella sp. SUS2]|nr:hypothetical protein AKG11_30965 [Shinella sp. SUS2]KOC71907.1 hypothetical protein AKG10_30385 [Shinella sp. GWS1]